jgi:Type ISP C-terminal specificity domain/N-6 DNA Methylase
MKDVFETYLRSLSQDRDEKTELSDRAALQLLLETAAEDAGSGIRIIHEAKKVRGKGGPDFKVMKAAMILGYVEDKQIGENLDQVLKSDQIARYKQLSNNILLTDYLHFIWLKDGRLNGRDSIAFPHELESRPKKPRDDRVKAVSDLLRGFFSNAPEGIGRAQQLALALATRSHFLRDYLDEELRRQEKEHAEGRLYGLFQIFRDQVFHELTLAEFADAFAQMLAYGLFLARLNSDSQSVTLQNARQYVPGSFRLIRELVDFLSELEKDEYSNVRWVVEEVLSIVNGLDLIAIHGDLSFKHRKAVSRKVRAKDEEEHRLFERDPFIYFYEDFLAKYDAKMKKSRGVYYTPPPIVNFIVRAIDDILKDTFGIKDGLADNKRVTVLDFACGTGTFLLEVFQRIFDNIGGPDAGRAGPIVREHLLKNIFGFEYLIAPYTIAHFKMSQYLADKGQALQEGERLQVLLTNTLEPMEAQRNLLLPALSEETTNAQRVKEKPILVITGNPPYSGHSKNKGAWITASIEEYRKGFPELSKPGQGKWLQDDYVKFIRFAQMKMDGGIFKVEDRRRQLHEVLVEGVEEGVVGIITNHSWLDNPTFRGMRKSLISSFNQIYVLDLHGSTKKRERAPDGSEDKNVFDIEQGVAISLFVKKKGLQRSVFHSEFWGSRLSKYQAAAEASRRTVDWRRLQPAPPQFLFVPQDDTLAETYQSFWSIPQIFSPYGDPAPCLVTTHDQFAISFSPDESASKVKALLRTNDENEARELFRLCSQDQWNYQQAKTALTKLSLSELATSLLYRPFDKRWTIWDSHVAVHRRQRVMQHMLSTNIGLLTCRQIVSQDWEHVFAAESPADDCVVSNRTKERGYLFPLYLYPPSGDTRRSRSNFCDNPESFAEDSRIENIAPAFREWLDEKYDYHYTPEEILGYIYAILHAPTYRTKYAEFLRIDFPRIPFPESANDLETLSILGWALVQAHLLRELPRRGLANDHGKGDNSIEAVHYSSEQQAVSINKTQSFKPVPQNVWEFHIGGYQVLDKYLKSRKGRKLSLDEINHVSAITDSLAFTIAQMAKIDEAYHAAFPDRG